MVPVPAPAGVTPGYVVAELGAGRGETFVSVDAVFPVRGEVVARVAFAVVTETQVDAGSVGYVTRGLKGTWENRKF